MAEHEEIINETGEVTNTQEHGIDHVSFNLARRERNANGGIVKETNLGTFVVEKGRQPLVGDRCELILRKVAE